MRLIGMLSIVFVMVIGLTLVYLFTPNEKIAQANSNVNMRIEMIPGTSNQNSSSNLYCVRIKINNVYLTKTLF